MTVIAARGGEVIMTGGLISMSSLLLLSLMRVETTDATVGCREASITTHLNRTRTVVNDLLTHHVRTQTRLFGGWAITTLVTRRWNIERLDEARGGRISTAQYIFIV